MNREQKVFVMKGASLEENCIKGNAAVVGNLDRGGDVIYPNAFRKSLKSFLEEGFVADSHDWTKMIAIPMIAREEGNGLYTESEFHTTPDAQIIRQKCKERMEKGKSVGLSIGFGTEDGDTQYFKSGEDLLAHAKGMGHDMGLFDEKTIRAYKGMCRAIKNIPELYEYSVVSVPMNPAATATAAKSHTDTNPQEGSPVNTEHTTAIILMKGAALGDVEGRATCSAISTVNSTLMYLVYSSLCGNDYWYDYYAPSPATADGPLDAAAIVDALRPAFDEFRDISLRIISAMLDPGVDAEEAKAAVAEAAELAGLFLPDGETTLLDTSTLKFIDFAARLGMDAAAFTKRTAWVRALREKQGRRLSDATRQHLQGIHDGLRSGCDDLMGLLADTEPDKDDDKTPETSQSDDNNTDRQKAQASALLLELEAALILAA